MTRQELIDALSEKMSMQIVDNGGRELLVKSPEGPNCPVLFSISIFEKDSGWHFGGTGRFLADQWSDFCRLGD